ncbi:MAG: DUF4271 domain-containing protein [Alloprevotella sp.]|nr:DUF4271 domain-containing protein [Alloprevotella sp.]
MPDSLSIHLDSLSADTLADSLRTVADTTDSAVQRFAADYSLLDSLLAKNVAAANGIHVPAPPYEPAADDSVVLALMAALVLAVAYLVRLRTEGGVILRAWSARNGKMDLTQPAGTAFGLFRLTGGLSLGVLLLCAMRTLHAPLSLPPGLPAGLSGGSWLYVAGTALAYWLYFALKQLPYSFVNAVFADRDVATQWRIVQNSTSEIVGLLLFPFAVLAVYLPLPLDVIGISLFVILCLAKSALLILSFRTFLGTAASVIHIFLYFCALEVVPLLLLWHFGTAFLRAT